MSREKLCWRSSLGRLGLIVGLCLATPALAALGGPGRGQVGAQFRQLAESITAAQKAGDLALAEDLARQRLALVDDGPPRLQGNAYMTLGSILRLRGRGTEAEVMLRKAQPLIEDESGRLSMAAIRGLFGLAGVLISQSRYAEADALLRDALERQQASRPNHPDMLRAYNLLARNRINMTRFDEAQALLKQAQALDLTEGEGWGLAYRRAQTMDLEGTLAYQRGQAGEAEARLQAAVEAYRAIVPETHPDLIQARIMLAAALLLQDRAEDAEALLQVLVPRAEEAMGMRHRETARAHFLLAQARSRLGRAGAEDMFRRSLEASRAAGHLGQLAQSCRGYAAFLAGQKRFTEALPIYLEALDAIDTQFARTRGLEDAVRESYIARYGSFYTETLNLLLRLHKSEPRAGYDRQALGVVSRTQSRLFTEMLRQADVGKVSADAAFVQLKARQDAARGQLAEMRRLRVEAGRDEEREGAPMSTDPFIAERLAARRSRLGEELAAREKALADADAEMWKRYPRYMELTQPRPVDVELLQTRVLKPGETLLSYALLPGRVLLFLVEKERFRLIEVVRPRKEVAALVAAVRRPLEEAGATLEGLGQLDPADLNALYRIVFEPVESLLPAGRRLLVVGDGPLHILPLEMLVSRWGPDEQRAFAAARATRGAGAPWLGEYAGLPYLGQRHAFAYLPSLSSLVSVRLYRKPDVRYDRELVSFADPVFERGSVEAAGGGPLQSRAVAGGTVLDIPRLPETADEAREIAAILGGRSDLYLREKAQERTAKTLALGNTRYLHFATHGLLGGEFALVSQALSRETAAGTVRNLQIVAVPPRPAQEDKPAPDADPDLPQAGGASEGQPALVLSLTGDLRGEDGLLTMGEVVESMDLNAQLVVLSACNTAGGSGGAASGEGFAGLTRAFMYAGARGLLVSHWSVESRSTQELVTDLFRRSRAGADSLTALGGARDKLLRSRFEAGRAISRAHPYFWAPFVYVGD